MKIILFLGCAGKKLHDIPICFGGEFSILDITQPTDRNIKIAEFLGDYELFNRKVFNAHTIVWKLQYEFSEIGKPVFKDLGFKAIEEFCKFHFKCKVYLEAREVNEEKTSNR